MNMARLQQPAQIQITLKKINDTYGHPKGDEVLKEVASILKDLENEGYWVLRNHGSRGDEFIVVFLNLGVQESSKLIEERRKKIGKTQIENINFTVSIGLSSFPEDGSDIFDIIKKADRALYFSKNTGRNRTTVYSDKMGKDIKTIKFRLEAIASIKKGSSVIVKSWKYTNPPDISKLEALELFDLADEISYTSRNKNVMTTLKTMEKEIRGVVTEVSRPSGKTLFTLKVQKKQLEGIPKNREDFMSPLV